MYLIISPLIAGTAPQSSVPVNKLLLLPFLRVTIHKKEWSSINAEKKKRVVPLIWAPNPLVCHDFPINI